MSYDDARGEDRYVGGGAKGGQNWSNEGYGANQSYSAGPQYSAGQQPPASAEATGDPAAEPASKRDYAVTPEDLDVADYDLQGGYGRPAEHAPPPKSR